jgi:hypothetical protein
MVHAERDSAVDQRDLRRFVAGAVDARRRHTAEPDRRASGPFPPNLRRSMISGLPLIDLSLGCARIIADRRSFGTRPDIGRMIFARVATERRRA